MSELTAALATIEKCREISGCPAGVDLQDHLRKLAAENVALKDCVANHAPAVDHWNAWADPEDKIKHAPETPATDRIVAGIKADGVEMAIKEFFSANTIEASSMKNVLQSFAQQLREGDK